MSKHCISYALHSDSSQKLSTQTWVKSSEILFEASFLSIVSSFSSICVIFFRDLTQQQSMRNCVKTPSKLYATPMPQKESLPVERMFHCQKQLSETPGSLLNILVENPSLSARFSHFLQETCMVVSDRHCSNTGMAKMKT